MTSGKILFVWGKGKAMECFLERSPENSVQKHSRRNKKLLVMNLGSLGKNLSSAEIGSTELISCAGVLSWRGFCKKCCLITKWFKKRSNSRDWPGLIPLEKYVCPEITRNWTKNLKTNLEIYLKCHSKRQKTFRKVDIPDGFHALRT